MVRRQSLLQSFCKPASVRSFGIFGDPIEPRSIKELEMMGMQNLAQTKAYGLDYEKICRSEEHGLLQ